MYRHAWESILTFSSSLADLSRACRLSPMTLDASNHIKPLLFPLECNYPTLRQLPDAFTCTSHMARHVAHNLIIPYTGNVQQAITFMVRKGLTTTCISSFYTSIDSMNIATLVHLLDTHFYIRSISLYQCCINDQIATSLFKSLRTNSTIHTINLSYNQIGDEGTNELATLIQSNTFIQTLILSGNRIGDKGAIALADALATNASIKNVQLDYNEIGERGKNALRNASKPNRYVSILGNKLYSP